MLNWARPLTAKLLAGKPAKFICTHAGIAPLVPMGTPCEILQLDKRTLCVGDIILCRVGAIHKLCKVVFIRGDRLEVTNGSGEQKWEIKIWAVAGRLQILEEPDAVAVGK